MSNYLLNEWKIDCLTLTTRPYSSNHSMSRTFLPIISDMNKEQLRFNKCIQDIIIWVIPLTTKNWYVFIQKLQIYKNSFTSISCIEKFRLYHWFENVNKILFWLYLLLKASHPANAPLLSLKIPRFNRRIQANNSCMLYLWLKILPTNLTCGFERKICPSFRNSMKILSAPSGFL